jgi:hypothetical protein
MPSQPRRTTNPKDEWPSSLPHTTLSAGATFSGRDKNIQSVPCGRLVQREVGGKDRMSVKKNDSTAACTQSIDVQNLTVVELAAWALTFKSRAIGDGPQKKTPTLVKRDDSRPGRYRPVSIALRKLLKIWVKSGRPNWVRERRVVSGSKSLPTVGGATSETGRIGDCRAQPDGGRTHHRLSQCCRFDPRRASVSEKCRYEGNLMVARRHVNNTLLSHPAEGGTRRDELGSI